MTPEQKAHVEELARTWEALMRRKYEQGVEEHGGDLWKHDPIWLLDQALLENIDQFVYLMTLRSKLIEKVGVPSSS